MSEHTDPRGGVIAMSTLGMNGRFGNQVLQYGFLRVYARRHGLTLQTPAWIGQTLFGFDDPPITAPLPLVVDDVAGTTVLDKLPTALRNVDLYSYCQYQTSYFVAAEREFYRLLFAPVKAIGEPIDAAIREARDGATLIAVHLRRGDYGHGRYFIAPGAWYVTWMRENWHRWKSPVLYVASDGLDEVLPEFAEFSPICERDLGLSLPRALDCYPDFRVLSQADVVAVSNSSYSFAACMLNERSREFVRPIREQQALLPFDPWNDLPVLDGGDTPDQIEKFEQILAQLRDAHVEYTALPSDANTARLRELRRLVAYTWIGATSEMLAILYLGTMGTIHRTIALSDIAQIPRDTEDDAVVADALGHLKDGLGAVWAQQYLLATMLLCRPCELPIDHDLYQIPNWLVSDYVAWLRTTR